MLQKMAFISFVLLGLAACDQVGEMKQQAGLGDPNPKLALGCDGKKIAKENTEPAKDNLDWTGTYTERHCNQKGKPCVQIRHLTLNADGTATRELIMNDKSMYKVPVKFTWENNGNVINVEEAGRFYVAQNQLLWLEDGNMIYPNASTLAMCKS